MKIELVFVTYNRCDYTRRALESVLQDDSESFDLVIWDNGSTDGTAEYLRQVSDPRITDVILSKENVGQTTAINEVWGRSTADVVGKLDNDCLVTPGWTRTLSQAHADIPQLGVVACWHYFADDFDYNRAQHKIQSFGSHKIMRHPCTCGTGVLVKREAFSRLGPIPGSSMSHFWFMLAKAGYVNGFYYPLVFQEHMDDPKSEFSHLKDEESYQAAKEVTFNINRHGQETLADRWVWRQKVLDDLLDGPWQVSAYRGWRARGRRFIKRALNRITG